MTRVAPAGALGFAARSLYTAAMRLLACAVLGGLALAGCGDDVVCPSVGDFQLTSPDGFAELVHGGTVTVAWTATGSDGASVELEARDTERDSVVPLPPANLGDGMIVWDGIHPNGWPAPPANYRLFGIAGQVGGCDGVAVTGGDLHLIVVQGVRLPTAPIAFTGSQATRMITVTTVTRSTLAIAYALDPSPTTDGDELVFVQSSVPGEFAPIARSYPFNGTTAAGAPVPSGDYDLIALVGDPTPYRVTGPRLTWRPAD